MQPPRLLIVTTEVVGLTFLAAVAIIPASHAGQLFTHSPLALRGGPGDAFAVTQQVDSGTEIDVLWCNGGSSWCLVQHDTGQGWAPLTSLTGSVPATDKVDDDDLPSPPRGVRNSKDDNPGTTSRRSSRNSNIADTSRDSIRSLFSGLGSNGGNSRGDGGSNGRRGNDSSGGGGRGNDGGHGNDSGGGGGGGGRGNGHGGHGNN
jgi:hypothetical protein